MENKIYNYPNSGIDRMIEQMQQSMKPIVNMINSTAYQNSIQLASTACVESCKIMQQCLKSNVVENIIEPTLSLYGEQMSRILEVIPTIITDNLYNTLSVYKNILNEINFNNLIINDNGTKYVFLMMFGGFFSQPGADAYSFFKDKFIRIFKKESITNDYFDNYSGLVQTDNSNTYISGWVYANGIKRIKKIKNKLLS